MNAESKLKDVLEGKLKVTDLTPEELPEFVKVAQAEADKTKGEVSGLREAKRAETEKVSKLQSDVEKAQKIISDAKAAEESLKSSQGQVTQFRQEQIEKAKSKFFSSFELSETDKPKVEEIFKKLDSGKIDADLIYNDFVSSYAAANPDAYLDAKKKLADMKRGADNATMQGAGSHQSSPGSGEKKTFDERTINVAREAGVTPEAADKVLKEGMTRKLA